MNDDEITEADEPAEETPVPVSLPRQVIEQWIAAKGIYPGSWVASAIRASFNWVEGREMTEPEFDAAHVFATSAEHRA